MFTMILAALAALQSPVPQQEPGEVRIFGDWAVGCDNGWSCEALSLASEDWSIGEGISLTIRRSAGPNSALRIGVRFYENIESETLGLRVDGRRIATLTDSGDELRYETDPGIARVILPMIAQGAVASIVAPTDQTIGEISLAGSSAALRYIDDRQQRAGTLGAAVAIGDRRSATVPSPPEIPTIVAMAIANASEAEPLPVDQAVMLHDAAQCDGAEGGLRRNEAYPLSESADLILISCSDGAYNFSDIAFVRHDGAIEPAHFDHLFSWGEPSETPLLVNGYWDAEAGEFSTYAKGRGLGDCGTAERFVWDGDQFRLIERREMNSCRGSVHWITVYRANVARATP